MPWKYPLRLKHRCKKSMDLSAAGDISLPEWRTGVAPASTLPYPADPTEASAPSTTGRTSVLEAGLAEIGGRDAEQGL